MNSTSNEATAAVGVSSATHASLQSEAIVCPQCGKASGPQTRFCGDCGMRLWEPCPKCDEPGAVNLRFCGGCGDSLADSLAGEVERLDQLLEQSEAMAVQGRFVEAITLLDAITAVEHSALAPLLKAIVEKKRDLTDRREEAVAASSRLLEEAKQLLEEGRIRESLAKVHETPEGLRNIEMRELKNTLTKRIEQADQLRAQIKEGLRAKQYVGLAVAAEKLRELEPRDKQVVDLAKKLRSKQSQIDEQSGRSLLQKACGALQKCDYRQAHQALERMPEVELAEEQQNVLNGARERIWLAMHVAQSPYIDEGGLKAAERLTKLQPHDEQAQSALRAMLKRRKEGLTSLPGQPIVWRKPTSESEPLGAPAALSPAPEALGRYAASHGLAAGQLLVAYGMALQGLGVTTHTLDLTPKKKSWLPRRGRRGRSSTNSAWGVDLGSSCLKAVLLQRDEGEGEKLAVAEAVCIPYSRPGEDRRKAELPFASPRYAAEALDKLFADRDLSNASVVIGAPGPWTLARQFKIPWVDESKFEEAVRYEARMRIPLEPDSVLYDQIVTELPEEDGLATRSVTLVACSKHHVESRLELFNDRKVKSLQVTSDCAALLNTAKSLREKEEADSDAVIAMVEIGAKTTNLAISHPGGVWVRGLYHGADAYDHRLVKGLQLGWEAAERTRREPWRGPWIHQIDRMLDDDFGELVATLRRNFAQFENEEKSQIGRAFFSGGGAAQLGLMRRLALG